MVQSGCSGLMWEEVSRSTYLGAVDGGEDGDDEEPEPEEDEDLLVEQVDGEHALNCPPEILQDSDINIRKDGDGLR